MLLFRFSAWAILLLQFLWVSEGRCEYNGPRGPKKYQDPNHSMWSRLNREACNQTFEKYGLAWEHGSWPDLVKTCTKHSNCMLVGMSENAKSYMASATIVLGLSPVLLSTIGPTLSEIGILSLNRPILATILSLGSVGVFPSRILSHEDDSALDILQRSTVLNTRTLDGFLFNKRRMAFISVLEYVLAAVAVFHIYFTSWQLGISTTLNFICQSSYMPIVWVTLAPVVYLPSVIGMHISARFFLRSKGKSLPILSREWELCLASGAISADMVRMTQLSLFLRWISTVLSFLHVIFGVIVYSSLLYMMTPQATFTLIRYLMSACVCRLILMFELAGIKSVYKKQAVLEDERDGHDLAQGM